jgi:hypothetical protein
MSTKSKRSGGPKTESGRSITSSNALKSGAYSKRVVLPGEDGNAFEALLGSLELDFHPRNVVELTLVRDIAVIIWKKARLENAAHSLLISRLSQPVSEDIVKQTLGDKVPEGLSLYLQKALLLSPVQIYEMRAMLGQITLLQERSNRKYLLANLRDQCPRLHDRLSATAQLHGATLEQWIAEQDVAFGAANAPLNQALELMEAEFKCSIWVGERQQQLLSAAAETKEAQIFNMMQDAHANRAADDLNRALYRTLAELRKLQNWRLDITVEDIALNKPAAP